DVEQWNTAQAKSAKHAKDVEQWNTAQAKATKHAKDVEQWNAEQAKATKHAKDVERWNTAQAKSAKHAKDVEQCNAEQAKATKHEQKANSDDYKYKHALTEAKRALKDAKAKNEPITDLQTQVDKARSQYNLYAKTKQVEQHQANHDEQAKLIDVKKSNAEHAKDYDKVHADMISKIDADKVAHEQKVNSDDYKYKHALTEAKKALKDAKAKNEPTTDLQAQMDKARSNYETYLKNNNN
ncbi:hypothetical protein, partial [Apilactobacillus xinyiensis]|uniref:hypothetical protein n=2 Tax=Apilactobacillus xinyiensis TaxID=2841032 RepID=UPI00200C27F2